MYKLIIADDEKMIQEGLANLTLWSELGFEVVGVFSDGLEIIEQINSMPIDVILTDIKMTHMSGIDVAKYVDEKKIPCKVVFISAHREFELAQQGIRYGVKDYILKPTKYTELKTIFSKIKEELDRKKQDYEQQQIAKERWEALYPVLEERFIENLVVGALDNNKVLEQQWNLLYPEREARKSPCMLAELGIKDYDDFLKHKWQYGAGQFEEAVGNFVKMYDKGGSFHIVYKSKERIRMFGIMDECSGNMEDRPALCNERLKCLIHQMSDVFRISISIEKVKVFCNYFQILEDKGNIIGTNIHSEQVENFFYEQKKMIMSNLMSGNISLAQKILLNVINSMSDEDIKYRRHFLANIFSGISEFLWENNQQLYHIVQPFILYKSIMNMNTQQEIVVYCNYVFDSMKTREALSDFFDQGSIVNRIKKYVRNHIYEDVTLENVADEMFISSEHLSRLFKKQTGENFLQFVTRMKMNEAIELLRDPQYRVYQVGERLGYKTTRHFSRLFYNYMGYYPSQYRKEVLGIGDGADEE